MHIAIHALPTAAGGGLTGLRGLLRGFQALPHAPDVTVLVSHEKTRDAIADCDVVTDMIRVPQMGPVRRLRWEQVSFRSWAARRRPDVVLVNNFAVPRLGRPQVVWHQDLHTLSGWTRWGSWRRSPKVFVQKIAARLSLAIADAHVYVSRYLRDQARRLRRWAARVRHHVVPYGLSAAFRREARRATPHREPTYRLAAIQSPLRHKDNETLLRAFQQLVAHAPARPWRLDIAGWRDWGRWRRRAHTLGIADRVVWRGYLNEEAIIDLLRRSDCLIFPSVLESFGLPVIEAMACRCPVVAVNRTAVPEVAGGTACLVPPRRPDAIARSVRRLQRDAAWRRSFIERGKARALQFCWTRTARSIYDVLLTTANHRP
jgi:glycosyltransferase involved in cell wall biosynthesis